MGLSEDLGVNSASRLVLGSAQLGMVYGVANKTGKPDPLTAELIVKKAWESGIREFDTAQAYGESERLLGDIFNKLSIIEKVKVTTKILARVNHKSYRAVLKSLLESKNNLEGATIHCLLLHSEDLLNDFDNGVAQVLYRLKTEGVVKNTGVSVYSPQKALYALFLKEIDCVQIPSNLLDRRFEKFGIFEQAQKLGKKIYVRSVFLQGLLLLSPHLVPNSLRLASPLIQRVEQIAQKLGYSRQELCLGYVKLAYPHANIIFGSESVSQLEENLSAWNRAYHSELADIIKEEFSNELDESIINPSTWS